MKAFVWGNNQIVVLAPNKNEAIELALPKLRDFPNIAKTVTEEESIEIKAGTARVLWTSW